MADVLLTTPEVATEDSERNAAAGDALRSDASLESSTVTTLDTASEHLPSLIIANGTDDTPKDANGNPTYTAEAATVAANDLSAEVHKGSFLGIGGPNFETILDSFREKTPDQIARMTAAYELSGGSMLGDIKAVVTDEQYRIIEGLATTRDGETNWAANLANLFESAEDGHQVGAGRSFREMFNTMQAQDYALLAEQWARGDYSEYGTDLATAIGNSNLSDMNKWLFANLYNVPEKERTTKMIEDAARHIVETYGAGANADQLLLYADVVGGEGGAEARANLLADKTFTDRFEYVFQNAPGWQDYLVGSTVSLNTTVTQNTDFLARLFGGGKTDEAIEYDLTMATDDERAAFVAGMNGTGTPEQIAFYSQLSETFNQRGSAEQAAIWTDVMAHGERTIISELATRSAEGGLDKQTALMLVENMSEAEWNQLKSNDGTQTPFLKELTTALSGFAPEYQQAVTEHLTKMSEASSYAEAQALRRSFSEIFAGASESGYLNPELLAYAMQHMSDADAANYKSGDPAFRQMVDSVVNPELATFDTQNIYQQAGLVFAQSMLRQVDATGKSPVVGDLERIALTMMGEDRPDFSSQMLDDLMKIPDAVAQMKVYAEATANSDQANRSLTGYLLTAMAADLDPSVDAANFSRLLRGERMDATYLPQLDGAYIDGYSQYSHLGDSPVKDEELGRMSAEEQVVAEKIIARGGETTETDFDRLYMIGVESQRFGDVTTDAVGMMEMLSSLGETERQQRFADYQTEYQSASFLEDFKARAAEENLSPEYQAVVDNFIKQGGTLLPADIAQLAVLKGGDAYKSVLPVFSALSYEARDLAKSDYAEKYGHDMAQSVLGMVENNFEEKGALVEALKSSDIDPIQQYLDRVANFDNTGVDVDGTRESMLRALQINGDVIQQFSEDLSKMPPEMVAALDAYFVHTVEQNRESKGRVAAAAEAAIDMAVMAAAIATLIPSGGTSAAVAAGILTTGARAPIAAAIQGNRMISESEIADLLKESALEAGLFMAPGVLTRATKGFNELAQSGKLKTWISSATHVDEVAVPTIQTNQGAATLDPAVAKWFREVNPTGTTTRAVAEAGDNATTIGASENLTKTVVNTGDTIAPADDVTEAVLNNADTIALSDDLTEAVLNNADTLAPADDATKAVINHGDTVVPKKATPSAIEATTSTLDDQGRAIVGGATTEGKAATTVAPLVDDAANVAVKAPTALTTVEQTLVRSIAPALVIEEVVNQEEVQTDFTPPVPMPNAEIIDLATVRRGEGPWQSAERILAAAGGNYDVMEVRALAKAIKAIYAADENNPDIAGLKVNHQFITASNFDNLIESVDNEAVEAALRGFAIAS